MAPAFVERFEDCLQHGEEWHTAGSKYSRFFAFNGMSFVAHVRIQSRRARTTPTRGRAWQGRWPAGSRRQSTAALRRSAIVRV